MSHTPGPWKLETVKTSVGLCHKVGPFPWKEGKENHACIYDDHPGQGAGTPELVANARLIAQAWTIPQLRAALEGLLENLDMDGPESADEPDDASVGWNGDGTEMSMTFGDIRRARTALALANEPADGGDDT